MNHKVHSLIIFMANPFSFSLAVFFKRETATPINQEARILDFAARPVVAKKLCFEHAHSVHFCALIPFTLNCRSVVIEKGHQFHACAFIAIQNQWDSTRMRQIDDLFL